MQTKRRKSFPVALFVAAFLALAADQISKALIRIYLPEAGDSIKIGFLKIRQVRNPGTAFGLIRGESWPLFVISVVIFAVLLFVLWRIGGPGGTLFQVGLGLICGGALGNIIDRIFLGEVVDFFDVGFWPIFNIADVAIVVGVVITLVIVVKASWEKEEEGA